MIARLTGAACRGLLVAILIATPALMLPGVMDDSSQITVLVALLAAFLVFIEYNSSFPSIVEFRDAPPYNRMRYLCLFMTVLCLSAIMKGLYEPNLPIAVLTSIGTLLGDLLDFPFSPVRLVVLMLPPSADAALVDTVRILAGVAYTSALILLITFIVLVRYLNWPTRNGAFNVWVNLPLFDPTAGGDVLYRLQRDARLNIALGFLLPFIIPAVFKAMANVINPASLQDPQTLIWTLSIWAYLPASLIMRGIAMGRIASMILDKRRRAYANAQMEEADFQAA